MTPQEIGTILGSPIGINKLVLKNRIVMGPMAVNAPTPEGGPSEQTIAFFERRARGGVGMIICGGIQATASSQHEAPGAASLRFSVDTFIPDFRRLADAVHAHDVPIIAEIMPSMGRMARPAPGGRIHSASPKNVVVPAERFPQGVYIPGGLDTPMPDEATIEEIERYEREMVDAAERVHRAGWDGVEVAAHMSYFAASFLSPRTNWRTDQYGGSLENRARMLLNIVHGIRDRLGRDFTVGLRITANDYMPDGQGVEGFAAIARLVEPAGIDYVALSPGCYETMNIAMPSTDGKLVETGDARVFKKQLSVPVLIQGLHDPARAAAALTDGHADFVMLSRQMIADPDYARKVVTGRADTIVRCDRDNQCLRRLMLNMPIRCSVNPQMGRESREGALPPAPRFVRAPLERLILGITGSRRFMGFLNTMVERKKAKENTISS